MLHILLCVLKWIGIILLSILALVLLILLAVLFVPLRYKVKGRYNEKPDAAVTVSWLLHLVHVKVRYTEALFWQVRILGIPFVDSRREKKTKASKVKVRSGETDDVSPEATSVSDAMDKTDEVAVALKTGGAKNEAETETTAYEKNNVQKTDDTETAHKGVFAKIVEFVRAFFGMIAKVFRNIRYTIHNICDKINNIRDNISYYHSVITSDEGRGMLAMVKRELGNLFKHIAPRKFKADLHFGFDDPATTGQVMGIAGMLYPIWNFDVTLRPDFEQKVMAGEIYIRGRVRVFTLIRIAWRVYFNKNLKKVLAMLKKGGANHG